jgi:hypothetical protein
MNFIEAFQAATDGATVSRQAWRNSGSRTQYRRYFYHPGHEGLFSDIYGGLLCTQREVLAVDWFIVPAEDIP